MRVLDLGCGMGRHAIALAGAGYRVTGIDVSEWALGRARAAAAEAGVHVDWRRLDLLKAQPWELPAADAAICVQAFGWGDDAEQLRMLRVLHSCLGPEGLLILDHSSVTAILLAYVPAADVEIEGKRFRFRRKFVPLTGRSGGELHVRCADGGASQVHDDIRLYQPYEVQRLLTAGGFEVERVDAEFRAGDRPGPDTRYVQFVARRAGRPDMPARRQGTVTALDLSWAPDEADYIQVALGRAWSRGMELTDDQLRRYALEDPFGERIASRLASHFECPIEPPTVCVGAGATGILRDLGTLAGPGRVIQSPLGHPALAASARRLGSEILFTGAVSDPQRLAAALENRRAVVVIDRPGIEGDLCDLSLVEQLAAVTAWAGAILVVDETCANYVGSRLSAARLTSRTANLVVVRSMSKGYCCGGLRVGFAVSSPGVAGEVREVATPLATSEFSLTAALCLLAQGDIFGPLRQRVAQMKPLMVAGLARLGIEVQAGDPRLPWVTSAATESTKTALSKHGVIAKLLQYPVGGPYPHELLRLSVPLSEARARAFLAAVTPSSAGGKL
jgi:histidinol-phosphate/aromatic aminotransferase/cobyric acid decarboxylase-like protein/SAM-dependent methyltransferase